MKKLLINTATNKIICEITTNHSMTLEEAIYCAGGEIINDENDKRYSYDGDNVIINEDRYWYEELDYIYTKEEDHGK